MPNEPYPSEGKKQVLPANIFHSEPKGKKLMPNDFKSTDPTTHIATEIFNHKEHNDENDKTEHDYEVASDYHIKEPLNKAVDWQEYNRELSELLTDLSKTEKEPTEVVTIFNTFYQHSRVVSSHYPASHLV